MWQLISVGSAKRKGGRAVVFVRKTDNTELVTEINRRIFDAIAAGRGLFSIGVVVQGAVPFLIFSHFK